MIAAISSSCLPTRVSRSAKRFANSRFVSNASRNLTNARMIAMFTFTARSLVKDAREHGDALLGEGVREPAATAPT